MLCDLQREGGPRQQAMVEKGSSQGREPAAEPKENTIDVLYVSDIARKLNCSRTTAWRLAKSHVLGKLYRLPTGRYFIRVEDFERTLESWAVEVDLAEEPRRRPCSRDLPSVPVELDRFLDTRPRG